MMKIHFVAAAVVVLVLFARHCDAQESVKEAPAKKESLGNATPTPVTGGQPQESVKGVPAKMESLGDATPPAKPAPITDGMVSLSPENSKVEFVGTHVGDDPKPRLGGFAKFSGKLEMSEDGTKVKSLNLDFDTTSLWTQLGGKLTDHLKTADFLDIEKYPTANFASSRVTETDDPEKVDIVGKFTLMGRTNQITLPAKIKVTEQGVQLKTEMMLDRTSFGMTKMTEGVSKEVAITFSVGEKTSTGPGSQMAGRNQRQRRGFDPVAMFKQQDADADGKLTGDEIPERIQQNIKVFDQDGDGAVTMEEMQAAIEAFRRGAGAPNLDRPGAGQGQPGGGAGKPKESGGGGGE